MIKEHTQVPTIRDHYKKARTEIERELMKSKAYLQQFRKFWFNVTKKEAFVTTNVDEHFKRSHKWDDVGATWFQKK